MLKILILEIKLYKVFYGGFCLPSCNFSFEIQIVTTLIESPASCYHNVIHNVLNEP